MKRVITMIIAGIIMIMCLASCNGENQNAGITLDNVTLELEVGAEGTISAVIVPVKNGDDTTLVFESSNPEIASCVQRGTSCIVKANKVGSCVISVTNKAGNLAAACNVTVTDNSGLTPMPPESDITSTPDATSTATTPEPTPTPTLTPDVTPTPTPTVTPDDTAPVVVLKPSQDKYEVIMGESGSIVVNIIGCTFTSDNTCVIVDNEGKFTGVTKGTAIITITATDGQLAKVTVVVTEKPNPDAGITIDRTNVVMAVGSTTTLKPVIITRFENDDKTLTFQSSNPEIATVDSTGKISAVAKGSAVITVTSADKLFAVSCTVNVNSELKVVDYPAKQVRHVFSHCLIAYPEQGCGDPSEGNDNLDVDCLTVVEFQRLLESLYQNGFCLIDINDMYENYTDENGVTRAKLKKYVQVPEGKKPLVISVDDVVYDSRKLDWGMIDRLEIKDGTIMGVKVIDGEAVYTDREIFPQLEKFIADHPDFSFNGAKCTLALTGFQGILGYRTDSSFADDGIDYMAEREKAQVVVDWLKANGYNFASHSYSHARYSSCSQSVVDRDLRKWKSDVEPLIGKTQVFVYPYGAFTYYGTETHNKLLDAGFTVFCGTSETNCLWNGSHPGKNGTVRNTGSIYLERYTITGQTLRDWRDFPSFYEYCDPYLIYDKENRFISMPEKTTD